MNAVCAENCEIPWEHVLYLSALEVCSRRGAIQIKVYVYLYLTINAQTGTRKGMSSLATNFRLCGTLFLFFSKSSHWLSCTVFVGGLRCCLIGSALCKSFTFKLILAALS